MFSGTTECINDFAPMRASWHPWNAGTRDDALRPGWWRLDRHDRLRGFVRAWISLRMCVPLIVEVNPHGQQNQPKEGAN